MSFRVDLPNLGQRVVKPCPDEPGHYLWLDHMGWHDCTSSEDFFIASRRFG